MLDPAHSLWALTGQKWKFCHRLLTLMFSSVELKKGVFLFSLKILFVSHSRKKLWFAFTLSDLWVALWLTNRWIFDDLQITCDLMEMSRWWMWVRKSSLCFGCANKIKCGQAQAVWHSKTVFPQGSGKALEFHVWYATLKVLKWIG